MRTTPSHAFAAICLLAMSMARLPTYGQAGRAEDTNQGHVDLDLIQFLEANGLADLAEELVKLGANDLADDQHQVSTCPVEPGPGVPINRPGGIAGGGSAGGGMAGNGWDGAGEGSATVYWRVEGTTADFTGPGQRQALIDAMQAWADVVQITFYEIAVANSNQSVDWAFFSGNHCAFESDECGDSDCPFDGAGNVLAHAGFPPGVGSLCTNPMAESFAGNVHFDEADTWEQDDSAPANDGRHSMTLIAAHEVGHAIGLTHDTGSGGPHIMRPSFSDDAAMQAPSASDIANIRAGYASGTGSVITLEEAGIWVDENHNCGECLEYGIESLPFTSISEGVAGVPPFTTDVVMHVYPGTYLETMVVSTPMHWWKERGTTGSVLIGGN